MAKVPIGALGGGVTVGTLYQGLHLARSTQRGARGARGRHGSLEGGLQEAALETPRPLYGCSCFTCLAMTAVTVILGALVRVRG